MKQSSIWLSLLFISLAGCGKTNLNSSGNAAAGGTPGCTNSIEINSKTVCYEPQGEYAVAEGDIVLGKISDLEKKVAKRNAYTVGESPAARTWPGNKIYYTYDAGLSAASVANLNAAIAHYHARTSVRFIPRTTETNFVHVIPSTPSDCRAQAGMVGGMQLLWFGEACAVPNAIHEFGHALGLYHEFSRPDRDQNINILFQNMISGTEGNFVSGIYGAVPVGPYDFGSIMHYNAFAFSKDGVSPTITKKDGTTAGIGNATALSPGDLAALLVMYPAAVATAPKTYSFGRPGSTLTSQAFLNQAAPQTLQWFLALDARQSGILATPQSAADRPVSADFDGDGITDLAVYRASTGEWFVNRTKLGGIRYWFGGDSSDVPVPGDYDGDKIADISVYRVSTGEWLLYGSKIGFVNAKFTVPGLDMPIPADYDGDGITDVAVYRPTTRQWIINRSRWGWLVVSFGGSDDMPIPADYDGDGIADLAVFRPSTAQWFILRSKLGGVVYQFGAPGYDVPVPADYDGDGATDIAIFRGPTGEWICWQTTEGALTKKYGSVGGDLPVPGNFRGGKRAAFTIYRPITATWFIDQYVDQGVPFGLAGYFY